MEVRFHRYLSICLCPDQVFFWFDLCIPVFNDKREDEFCYADKADKTGISTGFGRIMPPEGYPHPTTTNKIDSRSFKSPAFYSEDFINKMNLF